MSDSDLKEALTRIEDKVDKACASAERAADMAMATHESLKALQATSDEHGRRISRLELRDTWLPVLLSSVATIVAVSALIAVVVRGAT